MRHKLTKKITKCIAIPDIHAPDHNVSAFNCVLDYMRHYQPDFVVVLGDVGDFGSVSAWDRKKALVIEGQRIAGDMKAATGVLTEIAQASPKAQRFVTLGNHEDRIRRYIEYRPILEGLEELNVEERYKDAGYKIVEYGQFLRIGKLLFTHGLYTNMYHANKTLQMVGHPVVYGHTHDHQEHSIAQYDEDPNFPQEKEASSSGCLCNMNPDFMKNRQKKWTHGFQTITFESNGLFYRSFHKILKGSTIIDGIKYGGK